MSFSSTIDKNARHNFFENAITGTIDIYTINTYLAPIQKGLKLVFDKRDSVVFEQDFQPLQHPLSIYRKKLCTKPHNFCSPQININYRLQLCPMHSINDLLHSGMCQSWPSPPIHKGPWRRAHWPLWLAQSLCSETSLSTVNIQKNVS